MDAISYERATDVSAAIEAAQQPGVAFIGGGTNLLDLMKGGVARPVKLVDITRIAGLNTVSELPDGGLRIGALARMSDVAAHVAAGGCAGATCGSTFRRSLERKI